MVRIWKNGEGYPDPTMRSAIAAVSRKEKIDFSKFETYEELRRYISEAYPEAKTKAQVDSIIQRKLPRESYFQKRIMCWIEKNIPGAFVWKAAAGPYSRQGIPDVCCIINGKFFGLEVKRPFVGKATGIQLETIKRIQEAGGTAGLVSFEKDVEKLLQQEETKKITKNDERVDDHMLAAMINISKALYLEEPKDPDEKREYQYRVWIRWALEELLERRKSEK